MTLNATQVQTVIPSATATSKEITAAVEKLRVEPANVSTVLTGNTGILAQTISGMKLTETQEKALAKEINIASDNKLGNDRLTKAQKNTVTKTQMDAVDKIVTTGNPTDKTTLEKLFTDANDLDKTAIEAYFKASINELGTAGNTYMTSDAKYKVTQTLDTKNAGKFIYTVEEIIK